MPLTKHALAGPDVQRRLAEIYVLVGEKEKALEFLPLLEIPHGFSPGWLRVQLTFAPPRVTRASRLVRESRDWLSPHVPAPPATRQAAPCPVVPRLVEPASAVGRLALANLRCRLAVLQALVPLKE
jgi:hypothetical protein